MTDKELLDAYIEMWKETIGVQKHFNDIELRIRSLALTVLTFVLGGAALAVKERQSVRMFDAEISLGAVILLAGLCVWLAFYFMDQVWYHRFLVGAVRHGEALERVMRETLPEAGLTIEISNSSPYYFKISLPRLTREFAIRSAAKIRIFYSTVSLILLTLAALILFGS